MNETAKEIVKRLIDQHLISGEEAYTLITAIEGNKSTILPSYPCPTYPYPLTNPITDPYVTYHWHTTCSTENTQTSSNPDMVCD